MNMAKKQNSFSSTKGDRNGENVPAIAGVEINEIRMYSIEGKMYLPETDLPKLEYRLKAKNFIAERFTGMTDSMVFLYLKEMLFIRNIGWKI